MPRLPASLPEVLLALERLLRNTGFNFINDKGFHLQSPTKMEAIRHINEQNEFLLGEEQKEESIGIIGFWTVGTAPVGPLSTRGR